MTATSGVPNDPISREMRTFLSKTERRIDDLTPASLEAADAVQTLEWHGHIKTPSAQSYRIVEHVNSARTIKKIYGKTSAGTLTATFKINSTAITTGAVSATSTQSSVTPTAANVMAEGDALVVELSSLSSAANFSFTVEYEQALASS